MNPRPHNLENNRQNSRFVRPVGTATSSINNRRYEHPNADAINALQPMQNFSPPHLRPNEVHYNYPSFQSMNRVHAAPMVTPTQFNGTHGNMSNPYAFSSAHVAPSITTPRLPPQTRTTPASNNMTVAATHKTIPAQRNRNDANITSRPPTNQFNSPQQPLAITFEEFVARHHYSAAKMFEDIAHDLAHVNNIIHHEDFNLFTSNVPRHRVFFAQLGISQLTHWLKIMDTKPSPPGLQYRHVFRLASHPQYPRMRHFVFTIWKQVQERLDEHTHQEIGPIANNENYILSHSDRKKLEQYVLHRNFVDLLGLDWIVGMKVTLGHPPKIITNTTDNDPVWNWLNDEVKAHW